MAFSTFPNNPFPPSTAQFNEGKNDAIQAEIDAIKDGTTIDSFGGVETALATKTNLSNIAPAFDATSGVYAIGDKVIYDGVLYEFTSAHATAGEWDENEVQPVKVSELIDTLKSGLIGHSQTSGAPVDVDGTLQLNENVLSHGLILISMGRYSYESTFVAFKSRIEADAYSHATLYIDGTRNVSFTLSTTGLLTITATSTPVNITVWGVL